MPRPTPIAAALLAAALVASATPDAQAFCGFYVSGATANLYNDATMVVMMRDGQRTVLSMQNNYKGPPKDFALVIPVPVVLTAADVKVVPHDLFDKVDRLAAPRLVEYWEQDPCDGSAYGFAMGVGGIGARGGGAGGGRVEILGRFSVGEYDVLILGADDALGLEDWLLAHDYKLPRGASKVLKPYIEAGMKFFVARVDVSKVKMVRGETRLSPLRFHYDTPTFQLPIRLGLLNARGPQDLLVHVIARDRYEVANYPNVTIPTNLELTAATKPRFGPFYKALLAKTLAATPGAVVTEYAWSASSCDPCPGPTLNKVDLVTLGADVIPEMRRADAVLTRLHARYEPGDLGDDLVFREAAPIGGGREFDTVETPGGDPDSAYDPKYTPLRSTAALEGSNAFQARYIVRHYWAKKTTCDEPMYGGWGHAPDSGVGALGKDDVDVAVRVNEVDGRPVRLDKAVRQDVPAIGLVSRARPPRR